MESIEYDTLVLWAPPPKARGVPRTLLDALLDPRYGILEPEWLEPKWLRTCILWLSADLFQSRGVLDYIVIHQYLRIPRYGRHQIIATP